MQSSESESALMTTVARQLHEAITALESVPGRHDGRVVEEADAALQKLLRGRGRPLAEVRQLEALLWVSLTRAADRCSALADRLAELEEWAPEADAPSARAAADLARRLRRQR